MASPTVPAVRRTGQGIKADATRNPEKANTLLQYVHTQSSFNSPAEENQE